MVAAVRSVAWDQAPPSAARWRAQALGGLWISGGALGLLALLLDPGRGTAAGPLTAIGVTAVILGGLLVLRGAHLAIASSPIELATHLALAAGSVAIGACVAFAGTGSAPIAYGTLFVWIGLFAGAYLAPRATLAHVSFAMVAFAITLRTLDQAIATELLLIAGVTVTVACLSSWMAFQRHLANIDPLTGIGNRRALDRAMEAAMAEDAHEPLTLATMDLDHFKRFNDRYGHVEGDRLLAEAATLWRARLPGEATLARLGGDEFVVLLPGYGLAEASQLIDRLREILPDGQSCSAGVTLRASGDTPSMFLARADSALYEAKRAGRGRTNTLGNDADVALELWRALDANEFVLHYQPILSLADGELRGFEALIRWQHPTDGLRSPARFIAAAERSGAIHAIGRWVLDEACHHAAALRQQPAPTRSPSPSTSPPCSSPTLA